MSTVGSTIDRNISKLEDQLKLWGAKLDVRLAEARVAGQESKIESHKHLDDLKGRLSEAQTKLRDASTVGNDKWDHFKTGLESSWKELEVAFKGLGD
jgi:hypothetical protein